VLALSFLTAAQVSAQSKLQLLPVRGSSKVKLVYKTRSAVVDLDNELSGGSLAGDPPHRYKVLFTAEKEGFLYLVARVCSASPITDSNAPCGGDSPCAILWIKTNKALRKKEFQSEIYESCSFNYYDSKVKLTRTGLKINYGGSEKKEMTYENARPEKGLRVKIL
jgi:hypothetical protein